MLVGTSNTEIDLLNNKYVAFNVYKVTNNPNNNGENMIVEPHDVKL